MFYLQAVLFPIVFVAFFNCKTNPSNTNDIKDYTQMKCCPLKKTKIIPKIMLLDAKSFIRCTLCLKPLDPSLSNL